MKKLKLLLLFSVFCLANHSPNFPELANTDQFKNNTNHLIDKVLQYQLSQQTAWIDFEKKHGKQYVLWNETTGTPHRVFGQSIPINGFAQITENNVEAAARQFLNDHSALCKTTNAELRLRKAQKVKKIWYVSFVQILNGNPVWNSEIELRISNQGKVQMFGVDFYENLVIENTPILNQNDLQNKLEAHLTPLNLTTIEMDFHPEILLMPDFKGTSARFVYSIAARSIHPHHAFQYFLDAETGEILQSHNRLCEAIEGNVSGTVRPDLPTDTPESRQFFNQYVFIDGQQTMTDSLGYFLENLDEPATLTAELRGPYANIDRFNQPDAAIEMQVNPGDTVALVWDDDNSAMSERNVFYYTNVTHQFVKNIEPSFTAMDYPLLIYVDDDNSGTCNAFWDGNNIFYNVEATSCINSAHSPATIHHEYGHALNDRHFNVAGVALGMQNIALHEAMADVTCMMIEDENLFARGFFGPGTFTRNFSNTNRYPENLVGQQHTDGLILAGSFWDLKELTSIETAANLAHFAKYGTPDDVNLGIGFAEWFIEVVIADDDDGDLSNGTPNFDAINTAFCGHGIGLGLFVGLSIEHEELANIAPSDEDLTLSFSFENALLSSNQNSDATLYYSTSYFNSETAISATTSNGIDYEATIPAMEKGTLLKYYFIIEGDDCATDIKFPPGEKDNEHFSSMIGEYVGFWEEDFETNNGWTIGVNDDNATAGLWQIADPFPTFNPGLLQPGDDHTPNGTRCLVTGPLAGVNWFDHDIDGGKTTALSPIFDGTTHDHPVVQFYKWYSNETAGGSISPSDDYWTAQISNNGGQSFTPFEYTLSHNRKWNKMQFRIEDFVEPTEEMQLRFIGSDFLGGSIVEALVDDIEIFGLEKEVATTDLNNDFNIKIAPNPFSESVLFKIKNSKELKTNLLIYNTLGQLIHVSSFKNGNLEWGRYAEQGLYFYQIQIGEFVKNGRVLKE